MFKKPLAELGRDGFLEVAVSSFKFVPLTERIIEDTRIPRGLDLFYGCSYREHVVGSTFVGRPDGQFLIPRGMMDELLDEAAGDLDFVKKRLGISAKAWKGPMRRIDIAEPLLFNTRLATGIERGANDMFRWGGYTVGGIPEAVLDVVPRSQTRARRVWFRR